MRPRQLSAMPRFRQLPLTLYRIQPRIPVTLRSYQDQVAKGRSSFDLRLHDGLVQPIPAGSSYTTPNGMSLRPAGDNMVRILHSFIGNPGIYRLHEGLVLPEELCVFHERTDHYSLQTTEAVTLDTFNATLTAFLESLPPPMTIESFIEMLEDEDDQDN